MEDWGWGVESSTVILTFPFISSTVVPVLSGLSILVGAVQSRQLTRPAEPPRRRGRPTGDGRNERRRRPHRQGTHQARGGLGQDAVGNVVRVQLAEAGKEAGVVLGGGGGPVVERVREQAGVELLQVRSCGGVGGA